MDLYEILDRVVELLRSRKRVTYRLLTRQFNLDEATLADLKDELLFVYPQVQDEDGRGLVWMDDAVSPRTTPHQPAQPSDIQEAPVAHVSPARAEPPMPDAERRQLTVMFCDLVGSTLLSEQLDPEDYRDIVRAYQQTCSAVVQRFEGHVAQLLGDALLVYFGWPQAHEDDAQRAVRAGLGMLAAMGTLNTGLERDKGLRLAIRVGMHTGLAVVSAMGGGGHQEQLALGDTPNIASRIQGLAEPDTVLISAATYRLIAGYFTCEALGAQTLKGVGQPMPVYRVLGASGAQSRLEIITPSGLTPLVGREQEVGVLVERWQQAREGHGQVVLLSGEAGIGKSRLVQVLKEYVAEAPHMRLECRCSPYYQHTALYPITDLLHRTLQWQPDDSPEQKLATLEHTLSQYRLPLDETVPLFAALLSLSLPDDRYAPLTWTPQRQRHKTLEYILAMLLEQSERQPVLFILEDVHWSDPTTLEWLGLLLEQAPTASLLALLTCRPEFDPPWGLRSCLTPVALHRFARAQIEAMVQRMTGGKTLPRDVMQHLVEKTDGVPLYIEEMTKAILESGVLEEIDGHYELTGPLTSLAIPATLQDSLMARLDRLGTAKGITQLGATIGRQFSYELLQAVSLVDEATLQRELGRLVEAELVYQRGVLPQASYTFKHALIQDAAYQSLLKSTRQQVHQRIAQTIETRVQETVESQPELLAHHYTEAGFSEQAISFWQKAGQRAIQRSANTEAIGHLQKGLELLTTLPDTSERARQELNLQRTLGMPLLATKGFAAPEVEAAYSRARVLCQHIGDTSHIFPVMFGLWGFYEVRGDLQTAREIAEELLILARSQDDPALLLQGYRALGDTLFHLGEFVPALAHLEQGIALYDPRQHQSHAFRYGQEPGMGCCAYAALSLWVLGYPDQALQRSQEALALAQESSHPFSLGFALHFAARLHGYRREWQVLQERVETLMALSREHAFQQWLAWEPTYRGWVLTEQYQGKEAIAQLRQGLDAYEATGAELGRSQHLARLAEAYRKAGQVEEGLRVMAEAVTIAHKRGELSYEAELYRLKGEGLLVLSRDHEAEATSCLHQALDVARRQQAKSYELRAATNLARLWQSQGKRQDAYDLLAPVYYWFTEGFDTADLREAKALLDELRASP